MNRKKLLIITGAGLSADSGIQTFRDENGLWNGIDPDVVCNYNNWKNNFELVHNFYNKRRKELSTKKPNKMHYQIAKWKDLYKQDCTIFTQNIDGLLAEAKCEQYFELHGTLKRVYCTSCKYTYDLGFLEYDFFKCKQCNSKWIKPDVIFFNEQAPLYPLLYKHIDLIDHNTLVLIIGTSGVVLPINYFLFNKSSTNVLNNLKKEKYIEEALFDYTFYKRATEAVEEVNDVVVKFFDK